MIKRQLPPILNIHYSDSTYRFYDISHINSPNDIKNNKDIKEQLIDAFFVDKNRLFDQTCIAARLIDAFFVDKNRLTDTGSTNQDKAKNIAQWLIKHREELLGNSKVKLKNIPDLPDNKTHQFIEHDMASVIPASQSNDKDTAQQVYTPDSQSKGITVSDEAQKSTSSSGLISRPKVSKKPIEYDLTLPDNRKETVKGYLLTIAEYPNVKLAVRNTGKYWGVDELTTGLNFGVVGTSTRTEAIDSVPSRISELLADKRPKVQQTLKDIGFTFTDDSQASNSLSSQAKAIITATQQTANKTSVKLFNHLVGLNPDLNVIVVDKNTPTAVADEVSTKGGGIYKPTSKEVWVDLHYPDWYATPIELINRELIHSVTYDGIHSGAYTDKIKEITDNVLKLLMTSDDMTDDVRDRIMYLNGSPHELLAVTFAEIQVRDSLPKDVITQLNDLFTQITGAFDGRITSTNQSRNGGNSQKLLSDSNTSQSTSQSTRADGDLTSSQDNPSNAQGDETNTQTTPTQTPKTYHLAQIRQSLDKINSETFNGLTEFVFEAVTKHNPDVKLIMSDGEMMVNAHTKVPADYDSRTNTITLYRSVFDTLSPDDKAMIINHELIHALTEQSLNNPAFKDDMDKLQTMRNELYGVWQDNVSGYTDSMNQRLDMMLNAPLGEFIAYGLTDPVMAKWINEHLNTDVTVKAKKGFAEYIKRFLKSVYNLWFGKESSDGFNKFVKVSQRLMSDYVPSDGVRHAQVIIDEANDIDVVELFKNKNTGRISAEHNARLDSLINTFIGGFYQYTGNKALVNLAQGRIKNTSLLTGLASSDKEAYVTEALASVFEVYLHEHGGKLVSNGIDKLYKQAQRQFRTVKDLFADYDKQSADEQARLRAIHQSAFNPKNSKDSLAWFLALAVSNEEFGQVLSSHKLKAERSNDTWFDKFMGVLEEMVNVLNEWFFKGKGDSAKAKIDAYVSALALVETKARNGQVDVIQTAYAKAYKGITQWADKPIKQVTYHASGYVSANKLIPQPIRAMANVYRAVLSIQRAKNDDLNADIQSELLSELHAGRYGAVTDTINEVMQYGFRGQIIDKLTRLTKGIEQRRETVYSNTYKVVNQAFVNELSQQDKDSISQVLLRTELASLLNHGFKPKDIMALLDNNKRADVIKEYENRLMDKLGHQDFDMLHQIYALANYMATGKTTSNLIKSAEGIAIGLGSHYQVSFDKMDKDIFQMVDVLSSLIAVSMVKPKQLNTVQALAKNEAKGIVSILNLHQALIQKGKADFVTNPYNYQKGYLPEKVNPYRKIIYVTQDQKDISKYQAKGFSVVTDLTQDDADQTAPKVLMIHDEYQPYNWVSGALDMADTHHRGTPVYQQGVNDKEIHDVLMSHLALRKTRAKMRPSLGMYEELSSSALIPTYDSQGAILDYHYEMSHEVRDKLLERDNSFDELLATLDAGLTFKPERVKQQRHIAQILHADVKANFAKRPNDYVMLNFQSMDPEIQKMVRMIPYPFRAELQRLYGKQAKAYPIHKSMFTAMFGYQAYSVVRVWDKLDTQTKLNWAERLIHGLFTFAFKEQGRKRALQAERVIQDTMTLIKDLIVVRSGGVLLGNIISNTLLLMHRGINPVRILKDMTFAWRNAKNHRNATNRLAQIQTQLLTTKSNKEKSLLLREKKSLEESLERNPLKAYMQAGLMSTIVEDLSKEESSIYKTSLQKMVDDYTALIPKPIRDVFNEVTLGDGSVGHTFLAEATQFSDFSAKYTLAKYLNEQKMPMNKAIYEAQLAFINYDIPTNIYLDYTNRMGLTMFTKFFLRFQNQLVKMAVNAPVTTLMGHYGVEMIGGQGLLDPFVLNRLGNPIDESIFNLYDASSNVLGVGMLL